MPRLAYARVLIMSLTDATADLMPGTHASVFSIYRSTIQEGRRFGFPFTFWGMENE